MIPKALVSLLTALWQSPGEMFSVCEIYCGSVDNSMNLQQRKVSVFGKLVNVLLMEECGSFKNCSCLEGKGGGNREHERVPV